MSRLKFFFRSRATIITLIILALSAVTVGGFVPQAFITNQSDLDKWRLAHPLLAHTADLLGLHHIYTTPCFVLILSGVFVTLAISCVEQYRTAQKRIFEHVTLTASGDAFHSPLQVDQAALRLSRYGFRSKGLPVEGLRLVSHTWGYWGNFLLHVGLLVTITASLLIALTQQRGMLQLTVGESFKPGQAWRLGENGLIADELILADTIRLDRVDYSFWPNFGLRELSSGITIKTSEGTEFSKTARINSILFHRGIHVYQGSKFGHSFLLGVTNPHGVDQKVFLELSHPSEPDQPSFEDYLNVLGPENQLRAKYVVNGEMMSFEPVNPILTLRIDRQGREIGRISLKKGEVGTVGPYRFKLIDYTNWSQLIFVKLTGIEAVFFGFFIICLGGVLHYFITPRVVVLCPVPEGGTRVIWRATKFAGFYQDEFTALKEALGCEEQHG